MHPSCRPPTIAGHSKLGSSAARRPIALSATHQSGHYHRRSFCKALLTSSKAGPGGAKICCDPQPVRRPSQMHRSLTSLVFAFPVHITKPSRITCPDSLLHSILCSETVPLPSSRDSPVLRWPLTATFSRNYSPVPAGYESVTTELFLHFCFELFCIELAFDHAACSLYPFAL